MLARQPVLVCRFSDGQVAAGDFKDDHTRFGHEPRLSPMTRLIEGRCRCNP